MGNYMVKVFDVDIDEDNTSKSKFLGTYTELDSGIPEFIVNNIQKNLVNEEAGLTITPVMVKPESLDLSMGVLESNGGKTELKYRISISKKI